MFSTPQQLLAHLASLDFERHDEQSIREQWIYPLLTLLGYGDLQHRVDIPFKVDLANPVRAIGSHRYEVDYRPTVYGVGMWIIEAKKPAEDLFSPQHLGQAWSYATHPEIDVPFIVMANGERFCVYDITKPEWNEEPDIDIAQADLPNEFIRLDEALGARRVADFLRRRQLRHLRTALMAQLDEGALDQTLRDVEEIVENDARPAVRRNRNDLFLEAFKDGMAKREQSAREIGVLGIAYGCISPAVPIVAEIETCAQMIREMPADDRSAAFDEFTEAARIGETIRMTFALRVLRLAVALRLVDDEACGNRARTVAEAAARDAATGFADDRVAAAAHHFERVLPAFIARLVLADTDDALRAAEQVRQHMDVEAWIRRDAEFGMGADAMLDRQIELLFRAIWSNFGPWNEEHLRNATEAMRAALPNLPVRREVRVGQINNAFYEMTLAHDPLRPGTMSVIREVADPPVFSSETPEVGVRSAFAADLFKRYFTEPTEASPDAADG